MKSVLFITPRGLQRASKKLLTKPINPGFLKIIAGETARVDMALPVMKGGLMIIILSMSTLS